MSERRPYCTTQLGQLCAPTAAQFSILLPGPQVPSFLLPSPHSAPHARTSNPTHISQV